MRVMKFGGLVLREAAGFAAMAEIVRQATAEPLLLVVSAFSTATRDLERAILLAEAGREDEALSAVDGIMDEHRRFARELVRDSQTLAALEALLDESGRALKDFARGVGITRELTPRTLDAALSYGEYCAAHIVRHYLQEQGFAVSFADATGIVVTDAQHLAATPDREQTAANARAKLLPILKAGKIALMQGFVGRAHNGEITTMGRESSNFTAALMGEIANAREVVIWTDVEGIRSADPKLVAGTRLIPHLTYAQAYIAASNGVKPLDPAMVEPLRRAGIPLEFRSAFRPDGERTRISDERSGDERERRAMFALRTNVVVVNGQFTAEHERHDPQRLAQRLFPQRGALLSATYRDDSFSLLAAAAPVEACFRHYSSELFLRQEGGYDLISLLNVPPQSVAALASLNALVADGAPGGGFLYMEIGTFQSVSRIAVESARASKVLNALHALLAGQ